MVTFQEIPEEIKRQKEEVPVLKENEPENAPSGASKDDLYEVEGNLRKAEQIQVQTDIFFHP